MPQKKNYPTPNKEATSLENKEDYGNAANQTPAEIEEEFFPEPKKHPEQEYLE